MPTEKNSIRCSGCKKVIGELDYLNDGKLTIKCKCGVVNTIEATPPPKVPEKFVYNTPYQDRLNLVKKEN